MFMMPSKHVFYHITLINLQSHFCQNNYFKRCVCVGVVLVFYVTKYSQVNVQYLSVWKPSGWLGWSSPD